MSKIVGLLGGKGFGKDTCARYLIDELGYQRIGFADALYSEVAEAFGVTVEFLSNRETKETPLPQLALQNCQALGFAACFAVCAKEEPGAGVASKPRSPRQILQLWGTEYRRKGVAGVCEGRDDYWLSQVKEAIDAKPAVSFVITDVRFLNEYDFVRGQGGLLARIRRPSLEAKEAEERAKSGTAAHASETELLSVPVDAELFNVEGQPDSLRDAIFALVAEPQPA